MSRDRAAAETERSNSEAWAERILNEFDGYYLESRQIPEKAQAAFERRDPGDSIALSKRRLSIYGEAINSVARDLSKTFPDLATNVDLWSPVEARFLAMIAGTYEADLAFAFLNSVRVRLYREQWTPTEYVFAEPTSAPPLTGICRNFVGGAQLRPQTVLKILEIPGFDIPYADSFEDAFLIAEKVNENLALDGRTADAIRGIEMINAGFFRNRGAYLVGRLTLRDLTHAPFIIALLNSEDGIYADAVITSTSAAHNLFSSTLANFHVTNPYYHELSEFLHDIIPSRSLGLHYSTIGFNHVGKVAVMNDMKREMRQHGEVFETAVGERGTVAMGFSAPSSAYTLKVIRDHPTSRYKWGEFAGVESVLRKYGQVHEINRAGSMLDNVIYYDISLEAAHFEQHLLDSLLWKAGECVSLVGEFINFKHLIVQVKMIPLPVFLETASRAAAERVVINLGHCIKNNAAANIFNKDLDARNYGVARYRKVYLFDYDAIQPLTEVKISTNTDRYDGEEDIPDWFFDEGETFLPEEIDVGLCIKDHSLVRIFRDAHPDLLTVDYWTKLQNDLRHEHVPGISTYPEQCRLIRDISRLGTFH